MEKFALALVAAAAWLLVALGLFVRNLARARASGLPYVLVPVHVGSVPWALLQPYVLPLLDRLPARWTQSWLGLLVMDRCWHAGYPLFEGRGDTFIAVSPFGNVLHTCDAEATTQFFRGNDFEKPARLLAVLNIYGPTMTATERDETRLYRKVAAPFFTEDAMRRVWDVASTDARHLAPVLEQQTDHDAFTPLRPILAKMSLHVLNAVAFDAERDCRKELQFQPEIEKGHRLSYSEAMHTVLANFRLIFATPLPILKYSPFAVHKRAYQAYTELGAYIEDVIRENKPSLLDALSALDPRALRGNIFLFMFAGHEANGNTMTFILLLLACHPSLQRALQAEVDRIHSYEQYQAAMDGLVGGVINEALRLYPVIPFILKATWAQPRQIALQGQSHVIPPDTYILLHTTGSHRNPKIWPEPAHAVLGTPDPVAAFNPAHWRDWRAPPGAYFPFSEGTRGCLGKKFALVELAAAVVQLFKTHSVELAVPGVGPDTPLAARETQWHAARRRADYQLGAGITFNMSLRLTGDVPVRFVPRGAELFTSINEG